MAGGTIGYLNETWQWDTAIWGIDNSTHSPSARAFSSIAYFGALSYLKIPKNLNVSVLFGGVGPNGYLGDTWQWVGSPFGGASPEGTGEWKELHPTTSPSARANASMTYDAASNEIVLFGGQNSSGYLGDTWVFQDVSGVGQWSEIFPTVSPSARGGAAMVYDSEDKYIVLFGGRNSGGVLGDTWKFSDGVWTELTPTNSPPARYGADIIDCPDVPGSVTMGFELERVMLVGGTNGSAFFGDTWTFLAGNWTLVTAHTPGLIPFAFGGMSNDVDDGYPTIFSGLTASGAALPDFWQFD
jgi:hypothetical protein